MKQILREKKDNLMKKKLIKIEMRIYYLLWINQKRKYHQKKESNKYIKETRNELSNNKSRK